MSPFVERGKAAEYVINNTLHNEFGAKRFRAAGDTEHCFLFDGLVLPLKSGSLTEIDHVLISSKGVHVIETKSIKGMVYGERDSKKWFSVTPIGKGRLTDRGFLNPFRQNDIHCAAVSQLFLEQAPYNLSHIHNIVALLDADYSGWSEGNWGGDECKYLFTSTETLVSFLKSQPDVLKADAIELLAGILSPFYESKLELREKFDEKIALKK